MMSNFLRLGGKSRKGVNMGLVTDWDEFEGDGEKGVALAFVGGRTIFYFGDEAKRIVKWISENGDLPTIAPKQDS